MTPTEIKIALLLKGITQKSIARSLGVSLAAVNMVVNGRQRSNRVEGAICKAVDVPKSKAFPESSG